jgi:hydroxymethylbilane synthase
VKRHPEHLTIGSRGSRLALWQAEWVRGELAKRFPNIALELKIIKTTGDKILDSPLSSIGDKGLFTKEIEHALLHGEVDLAVHSLKDLPTSLPRGLAIGAITQREDTHDVFIANKNTEARPMESLPPNATIATGSLRRRCQLLHWRSDLTIVDLRGNLNTRFARLDESTWEGMILARAGVLRLGFEERITEIIPFERMLPAVGQGALGIEIRENDDGVANIVAHLASQATTYATLGERAFLRYLEGGCQVPIGTHGRIEQNVFRLDAVIGSIDGRRLVRGKIHGEPAAAEVLGEQLAKSLYKTGGREILEEIRLNVPQIARVPEDV